MDLYAVHKMQLKNTYTHMSLLEVVRETRTKEKGANLCTRKRKCLKDKTSYL
jgi:hypothetical protein